MDIQVQRYGFWALPIAPLKVYNRANALLQGILDGIGGPTIPIFFAFLKKSLLYKNTKRDTSIAGISYGMLPRQRMDLFVPLNAHKQNDKTSSQFKKNQNFTDTDTKESNSDCGELPVIIVFPGYSWNNTAGLIQLYKPMAQTLCDTGVFVILPNLGLPGKTSLSEILEDMQLVVEWTVSNIGNSGGDPKQIHLLGFGAGAHMCSMYNVASALSGWEEIAPFASQTISKLLSNPNASAELVEWLRRLRRPVIPVAGLILISGVYSLEKQRKYEEQRCIETLSMSARLFDSIDYAEAWSPLNILVELRKRGIYIPNSMFAKRVLIIHGQKDSTFPLEMSQKLFQEFCLMDMDDVNMKVYANLRRIDPSVILSVQDASLARSFLEDISAALALDDSDNNTLQKESLERDDDHDVDDENEFDIREIKNKLSKNSLLSSDSGTENTI
ncbi:hypothetical protein BB558_003329 [Smittium angustum]|uniref:BD-FAE-like domain-containing protein n=1 Tax=Smittium angustum TaxID=133377 RepID=A0A2U1J6A7_SMIAN|nr:hypothetical protein BB558_003329 [Smittium angustum]